MAKTSAARSWANRRDGIFGNDNGPAGMSKEIVSRLNAEIGRILFLPEVKKRMEDIAVETAKSSPEELATLTRADADKWGKIIKQLGITPE